MLVKWVLRIQCYQRCHCPLQRSVIPTPRKRMLICCTPTKVYYRKLIGTNLKNNWNAHKWNENDTTRYVEFGGNGYFLASSRQRLRDLADMLFNAQASIRLRKSVHFRWCGNSVKDIVLTYRFSSPCRKQRRGWLEFQMRAKHRRSNSWPSSCNTQPFHSRLLLLFSTISRAPTLIHFIKLGYKYTFWHWPERRVLPVNLPVNVKFFIIERRTAIDTDKRVKEIELIHNSETPVGKRERGTSIHGFPCEDTRRTLVPFNKTYAT